MIITTRYIMFATCLLTHSIAQSQQQTPLFEMRLFFEDAIGNRDTLEVGYDFNTCCYDTFDPTFGEVGIDEPFDSILDVRAIHAGMMFAPPIASKRIIARYELWQNSECGVSEDISIFFNAKYLPITITYDSAALNSSGCNNNTILSPTWGVLLLQYWWEAELFYCMANSSVVVDDGTYFSNCIAGCPTKEFEVEGQGLVELPGYLLIFKEEFYCQTVVATENVISKNKLAISPVPTRNYLTLDNLNCDGCFVDIYAITGTHEERKTLNGKHLDVSDLNPGMYIGVLQVGGIPQSFKFIVSSQH